MVAFLASSTVAPAQEKKEEKSAKRGAGIEQRVDRMAQELNLNEQQKTKLRALFEDQQKKLQELRADTSASKQDRGVKARAMREEYQIKLKEILTPDQYTKLQKDREENAKKFKDRAAAQQKKAQKEQ